MGLHHPLRGRAVANDDNSRWLRPAFNQMHRVLKPGGFCVSFYGWNKVDLFMDAWRLAGFRVVGHLVFASNMLSVNFCAKNSAADGDSRSSRDISAN